MAGNRPSARRKILEAAAKLADDTGPGSLSLEAVAKEAGISKGGLLYHFPSKAALMRGLVEDYMEQFEAALQATMAASDKDNALVPAFIAQSLKASDESRKPSAWFFTAMAEDPDFLRPVHRHRRHLLDRLLSSAKDPTAMLITFLTLEGLHSLKLFGSDILSPEEKKRVSSYLLSAGGDALPDGKTRQSP